MALGAMLVAGAVPASAKSQVDFSGVYKTYMIGSWNSAFDKKDGPDYDSDFFLADRLQLDFGFNATDEVSVYWRLRAPSDNRWGNSNSAVTSKYYFGEIKQDWGTLSLGRLKDSYSNLGLASLGYAPAGPDVSATYIGPFDYDNAFSGVRYANRTDGGFQMAAAILRLGTKQHPGDGSLLGKELHDETTDLYVIEPAFFFDNGGASFGIHYLRDHSGTYKTAAPDKPAYTEYSLNPAVVYNMGDLSIHFEAKAGFGKSQVDFGAEENKNSGYAGYLDFDYNYGPGNAALAMWYASGPGDENGDKAKGTVGFEKFTPLLVAYGANEAPIDWYGPPVPSIGKNNYAPLNVVQIANFNSAPLTPGAQGAQADANHWAAALLGAHAFSDDLTMTYALGYLNLVKVKPGAKKQIGTELDLGLQIQLLDNLSLGSTVGYLMAGDALKDASGEKPDPAYTWYSTLIFSF